MHFAPGNLSSSDAKLSGFAGGFLLQGVHHLCTKKTLLVRSSSANGWIRFIVEKPFGRDFESSVELTRGLKQYLIEEQIYRSLFGKGTRRKSVRSSRGADKPANDIATLKSQLPSKALFVIWRMVGAYARIQANHVAVSHGGTMKQGFESVTDAKMKSSIHLTWEFYDNAKIITFRGLPFRVVQKVFKFGVLFDFSFNNALEGLDWTIRRSWPFKGGGSSSS
eukprot:Gb_33395 [translate_table: standard]